VRVRGRLEAICRHRGISLGDLDVAVITESTVRLDSHRDQIRLRATVARFRPRLLVLAPLVRLHSLDETAPKISPGSWVTSAISNFRRIGRRESFTA
jgi:hypothetical protein